MEQPGESRLESLLLDSAVVDRRAPRRWPRILLALGALWLVLGFWWSRLPDAPVAGPLRDVAGEARVPAGLVTATMLQAIVERLLDKPGGWLSNDALPPGAWLDNMPAFERGALGAVRDLARALRRDFGRAPEQALEDPDLQRAEPRFFFDPDRWPGSEAEYRDGIAALDGYRERLRTPSAVPARFTARADTLARWLDDVDARLDAHVRRLGAASPEAEGGATPWAEQDDAFFEARGYAWALRAVLGAIAIDFRPVLAEAQAVAPLDAAIGELGGTQRALRTPMILGGSEYGVLANHSLVMGGYLARARTELQQVRARLRAPPPG